MYDVTFIMTSAFIAVLVHTLQCIDFQAQLVSFDLELVEKQKPKEGSYRPKAWMDSEHKEENKVVFRALKEDNDIQDSMESRQQVTRTPPPEVECLYQYPEMKQVNIMLSNMMNELTKVFTQANEWLKEEVTRRSRKYLDVDVVRRALDTRFKIANGKRKQFFEDIYFNMTNDYRDFYNTTTDRQDRAGRDACQHQDEIKQLWRDLLEYSLLTLKRAMRHCVDEFLKEQQIPPESKLASRVNTYLVQEMSNIRSNQLKVLCDQFQLCYAELLQDHRSKSNFGVDNLKSDQPEKLR